MAGSQFAVAEQGIGTLLNTYTTAKSIISASSVYKIPAGKLYVGKKYRINALMGLTTDGAQGTFTFQVMGGPTSNIIVWQSGALVSTTTASTLWPCKVTVDLLCAAIGAGTSAQFTALGEVNSMVLVLAGAVANSTIGNQPILAPNASMANPSSGAAGFNSTVDTVLDFWLGLSISNATNGVQIYDYYVEDLNGPA